MPRPATHALPGLIVARTHQRPRVRLGLGVCPRLLMTQGAAVQGPAPRLLHGLQQAGVPVFHLRRALPRAAVIQLPQRPERCGRGAVAAAPCGRERAVCVGEGTCTCQSGRAMPRRGPDPTASGRPHPRILSHQTQDALPARGALQSHSPGKQEAAQDPRLWSAFPGSNTRSVVRHFFRCARPGGGERKRQRVGVGWGGGWRRMPTLNIKNPGLGARRVPPNHGTPPHRNATQSRWA